MRRILLFVIIALNGIIIFYACKKEDLGIEETKNYETLTSQDNSLAESTFNDINNMALEAIQRGDSGLSSYRFGNGTQDIMLSNCATVTRTPDSAGTGGNIVIDFHNTNCLCNDSRYRHGIININYTGAYRDSGTVITTTFNNYFVGKDSSRMFQVTGTKSVTNKGRNGNGNINYDIAVNGHLINSNGESMSWISNRNREWIAGEPTIFNWLDDEYSITGSASGTSFEGASFTVNITSALHIKIGCPYITSGTFELTPSGLATRTFDYGSGVCDAIATVAVNDTTFQIYLR